jgi:hypothetical protein
MSWMYSPAIFMRECLYNIWINMKLRQVYKHSLLSNVEMIHFSSLKDDYKGKKVIISE